MAVLSVLALLVVMMILILPGNSLAVTNTKLQLPSRRLQSHPTNHVVLQWKLNSKRRRSSIEGITDTDGMLTRTKFENNDNSLYSALSTGQEQKPNRGNFFYNDEVSSHLYGYIYLVGFFAAQDALFLGFFFILSGIAAYATEQSMLPANPRVPAIVALLTLASTLTARYVLGFEPPVGEVLEGYRGPTDSALLFEAIICLLNASWGFFGTWRTNEPVDGATYGF